MHFSLAQCFFVLSIAHGLDNDTPFCCLHLQSIYYLLLTLLSDEVDEGNNNLGWLLDAVYIMYGLDPFQVFMPLQRARALYAIPDMRSI
jgi:hypothetical protein